MKASCNVELGLDVLNSSCSWKIYTRPEKWRHRSAEKASLKRIEGKSGRQKVVKERPYAKAESKVPNNARTSARPVDLAPGVRNSVT